MASTTASQAPASSAPRWAKKGRESFSVRTDLMADSGKDSRPLLALAIATTFGVGYVPVAPGTFGSAAGLALWMLLPASAGVQAAAIVATLRHRLDRGERGGAPFRPHRPASGRDRRSDGNAHHPLSESRRLAGRVPRLSALPRHRRDQALSRQPSGTAPRRRSASWPTTRWRPSTRTLRFALCIWSSSHLVIG